MIESKNKLFEIGNFGEVLVSYEEEIIKHPTEKIEFHGIHEINHDEVTITLTSVELIIKGRGIIDVLPVLTEKEKQAIIDDLD